MSAANLFRTGGDLYDCVPRLIDQLPQGDQHAATKVFQYLMRMDLDGQLNELITDRVIADAIGYSTRFVQKGLHALQHKLGELGQAIIDRMPNQGRRIITFIRGLAARRDAQPRPTPNPPQTPPEELKTKRETSTDTPPSSSSSPEIIPKTNPDDPAFAVLVARACGLIPDATPERVGVTIATYGGEWVGLALDQAEKRNQKPGKLPVRSWRYVLGILDNWRREGGPPAPTTQAPPAPPARRPAPEPAAPPSRLTAEEVADLLARCASAERMTAQLGRVSLRIALREGTISPELLATIPEELLPPPAGPEVPGAGPGS
jgi:hypothetical protein